MVTTSAKTGQGVEETFVALVWIHPRLTKGRDAPGERVGVCVVHRDRQRCPKLVYALWLSRIRR